MPGFIELIPAYGRDYKSAAAVKAAWEEGKDFIIADMGNRWYGKPINKEGADEGKYGPVLVRYSGLRKLVIVKEG